jgi:hypothetical protein
MMAADSTNSRIVTPEVSGTGDLRECIIRKGFCGVPEKSAFR